MIIPPYVRLFLLIYSFNQILGAYAECVIQGLIGCVIMMEWDTLNLRLQHLLLAIYKYKHLYEEIFGWCASISKKEIVKSRH